MSLPPTQIEETIPQEERTMGMLCHLLALIGVPLGNILGPLIIWLIKKENMPFVEDQGKESLNFQISMLIYVLVSALLTLLVVGISLLIALVIFELVIVIMAGLAANQGKYYRYPLCIRFIH